MSGTLADSERFRAVRFCYLQSPGRTKPSVDNIDERHQAILPAEVWADGDPEGSGNEPPSNVKLTARACRNFLNAKPHRDLEFPAVVNGFSGSSIWHACYAFPPTSQAFLRKGYDDFARRFLPILEVFEDADVNFALEVHPTEIAVDIASARRALKRSTTTGGLGSTTIRLTWDTRGSIM